VRERTGEVTRVKEKLGGQHVIRRKIIQQKKEKRVRTTASVCWKGKEKRGPPPFSPLRERSERVGLKDAIGNFLELKQRVGQTDPRWGMSPAEKT